MHLDEGTIHAWLDGALDAEEAARVERHAAECAACGAAVAEARGLVAGASRILTALDNVPSGVLPRTASTRGGSSARRPRTLWTTLHLTPVRAAAAAVIIVAAGSALGIANRPNDEPSFGFTALDKKTAGALGGPGGGAAGGPAGGGRSEEAGGRAAAEGHGA